MSEDRNTGPFGQKSMFDSGYWQEQKQLDDRNRAIYGSSGGGSIGLEIYGIPLLIPTLLVMGGVLYPLSALVTLGAWYAGRELSQVFGLVGFIMYIVTYVPAAVVMWFACRWDAWFAQNFTYWIVRHLVRNVLFVLLLILMATHDTMRGKSDAEIFQFFFHNSEALEVTAVALVIFNVMLIGKQGMAKTFWRGMMEIAHLRPLGLN